MGTLTYLPAGTIKRLHVDRRIVASNRKTGANEPAITVQTSKGPMKARHVNILGHSEFEQAGTVVSSVDGSLVRTLKPLGCGARLWIKTKAALEVVV